MEHGQGFADRGDSGQDGDGQGRQVLEQGGGGAGADEELGSGAHGGIGLPVFGDLSVEAQDGVDGSTLEMYRQALRLRRRHPGLHGSDFAWADAPPRCLAFRRGPGFRCLVNLSDVCVPLPGDAEVLLASGPLIGGQLPPDHAAWLAVP